MNILINFLVLLAIIAAVYLVLYLFQKWVTPIDPKIVGVVLFILFVILTVVVLRGGSLLFWR
jgi:hypothetical protein